MSQWLKKIKEKMENGEADKDFRKSPMFVTYLLGLVTLFVIVFMTGYQPLTDSEIFDSSTNRIKIERDYSWTYFASKRVLDGNNFYFPGNNCYPDEPQHNCTWKIRLPYPPLLPYVFAPLAALTYEMSILVYSFISVALLLASIFILSRLTKHGGQFFFITATIFMFSPFFLQHLNMAAADIVVLFLVSLILLFHLKGWQVSSGFFLASAIFFKLMPIVFVPYFFYKSRRIFYSTAIFSVIFLFLFGFGTMNDFLKAVGDASMNFYSVGSSNNGIFGLVYNRLTYGLLSMKIAKVLAAVAGIAISALSYYIIYRANRKKGMADIDTSLIVLEFATLLFLMSFLPTISWIRTGLFYVFAFAAYWDLREMMKPGYDYLFQILFYLVISQPLLFPIFNHQPVVTLFAMRPLYMLIVISVLWVVYFKKFAGAGKLDVVSLVENEKSVARGAN